MEYTALVLMSIMVSIIMYVIGYAAGEIKTNQKIINYCRSKPMNLTGEVLNDLYPQLFWIQPKQVIEESSLQMLINRIKKKECQN